jgi:hypothetical protein
MVCKIINPNGGYYVSNLSFTNLYIGACLFFILDFEVDVFMGEIL